MKTAIMALGLLVTAIGLLGIVRPAALMALVASPWRSPAGYRLAMVFRAGTGLLLLAAASSTRLPWLVTGIGVLALAAAASMPLLGYERLHRFVQWWNRRPAAFVRGWSVLACVFGGVLVYAAW